MKKLITIYTPTYNRGKYLNRVYESLCLQKEQDFKWLIIDDGSTDNTKKIVEQWIKEGKIDIKYVYKENGGVHTARDLAFHICDTELIVSCDSDDWLTSDAVQKWRYCWINEAKEGDIGIYSVVVNQNGQRITNTFPNVKRCSYQEYTYKYGCTAEKHTVIRTDVISKIPDAPIFKGEKIVGEIYKWIQLPVEGQFILLDAKTRIYEQQVDGYISNVAENRFRNPNGFREMYRQIIIHAKYPKARIKAELGYIAFSIIAHDGTMLSNSPNPVITILLFPFGICVWLLFSGKRVSRKLI